MKLRIAFLALCGFLLVLETIAQTIVSGYPLLEEVLRRDQLNGKVDSSFSFLLRPIKLKEMNAESTFSEVLNLFPRQNDKVFFGLYPIRNTTIVNSGRPYGWGNGMMIPNVGGQNYTSTGVYGKFFIFNFHLQPEFLYAQNLTYQGYPSNFPEEVNRARFRFWNVGDFPEKFGEGGFHRIWWGQSKLSLEYGGFEAGISTENIWWGPGQFNALALGTNAQGFPHLTLNTIKPAKTFLGSFEAQLIMGRLEDSQLPPSQHEELNQLYFRSFSGDWKFLNAFHLVYQPKWVHHLFIGFTRTYQQYDRFRGNRFRDWFPVLDPFQKTSVGFDRDPEGKDQQVTVSMRYLIPSARAEIYAEYGRRDHALNWREFILNPEHARAYLIGFNKVFLLHHVDRQLQVRGEMVQQQESINRYIRYPGLEGGLSWHTHSRARGFTNHGQALGVGTGVGSNVQTMEFSIVEKLNKMGILLERVANHQDFYYRAFGQQQERQPWVDLSLGLLFDHQWDNLLVSSKLQFIHGRNYQWQLDADSTPEFPSGDHKFAWMGQVHLIYLWNQRKENKK
ncbi:MAG: capsule assembly Wzi family protein [Cyclobacterium sp.]|uniref:capsule assembly Wzi family protein n=1 Tax=Cyclobacterium sp. TaxID=1966343 RepID=UPI003970496C